MKIHEILEQYAIYGEKPNFMPGLLVMNVLNHNSEGGTKEDLEIVKAEGYLDNPKRYKVRVTIEYEPYYD